MMHLKTLLVTGVAIVMVATPQTSSAETTPPVVCSGGAIGGGASAKCDKKPTLPPPPGPGPSKPVYTTPYEYRHVPNCRDNTPDNGGDYMCMGATMCPEDGDINMRVYRREAGTDGSWESLGARCMGADEAVDGPGEITEADVSEEAERLAPKPVIHVEPETKSYVNVPTNVYADTEGATETVDILGIQISMTFTPTAYHWNFGDGGKETGAGIENAKVGQTGAVEYAYRRQGDYAITLTRSYDVSFTMPDGQMQTLPTPITNVSDPYDLGIGEVQSVVTKVR